MFQQEKKKFQVYKRNNGFSKKPHFFQLISYLVLLLNQSIYWIFTREILFQIYGKYSLYFILLQSGMIILSVSLVILGFLTSFIDPTDDIVIKYRKQCQEKEFRRNQVLGNQGESFRDEINSENFDFYCDFCQSFVKKNTKHCKRCDRCVDQFDHHCKWVNNCIGNKNYKIFVAMILSLFFYLIFNSFLSIYCLNKVFNNESQSNTIQKIFLIINSFFCLVGAVFDLNLVLFHFWLISKNISTFQYLTYVQNQNKVHCQQQEKINFNPNSNPITKNQEETSTGQQNTDFQKEIQKTPAKKKENKHLNLLNQKKKGQNSIFKIKQAKNSFSEAEKESDQNFAFQQEEENKKKFVLVKPLNQITQQSILDDKEQFNFQKNINKFDDQFFASISSQQQFSQNIGTNNEIEKNLEDQNKQEFSENAGPQFSKRRNPSKIQENLVKVALKLSSSNNENIYSPKKSQNSKNKFSKIKIATFDQTNFNLFLNQQNNSNQFIQNFENQKRSKTNVSPFQPTDQFFTFDEVLQNQKETQNKLSNLLKNKLENKLNSNQQNNSNQSQTYLNESNNQNSQIQTRQNQESYQSSQEIIQDIPINNQNLISKQTNQPIFQIADYSIQQTFE